MASVLTIFNQEQESIIIPIGVISGCFSGVCVAIARMANKDLLKEAYYVLFKSKATFRRTANISMQEDLIPQSLSKHISYLSDFFNNLTKRVFST